MRALSYGIRGRAPQPASMLVWTCRDRIATALPMIAPGIAHWIALGLAALSLAVWVYLVFARGGFWLGRERDDGAIVLPATLPGVAIVVPARNEAEHIAQSVTSLLIQDYPALSLIVVDDDSDEGTAAIALRAAGLLAAEQKLSIVSSRSLPPGWTGKLWAVKQ